MSVSADILASYRGPGAVMRRLMASGAGEGRALAILMAGCAVTFIAQWPRLARQAHLTGQDLQPALGGALLGWMFIAPLGFYLLAALGQLGARALGARIAPRGARLALFWSWLAASPLLLLHGLVAGFIGPGAALNAVGAVWLAVFAWFWLATLAAAGRAAR